MSRLTEKVKNTDDYIRLATKDKQEFINKLGRLEDMEEELGFSLEKLNEITHIYANDWENILTEYTNMTSLAQRIEKVADDFIQKCNSLENC